MSFGKYFIYWKEIINQYLSGTHDMSCAMHAILRKRHTISVLSEIIQINRDNDDYESTIHTSLPHRNPSKTS